MVLFINRPTVDTTVVEDITTTVVITTTTVTITVSTIANITMAITVMKVLQEPGGKKH